MNCQDNPSSSLAQSSKTSIHRIYSTFLFKLSTKLIVLVLPLLASIVQASPFITISGTTPDEQTTLFNGVDPGVQATDFCVLATGDTMDEEPIVGNIKILDDYNLSEFGSSQRIVSASVGHQWEVYGGGETGPFNEGLCYDFPGDSLEPGGEFSVSVELSFQTEFANESDYLTNSGIDTNSCVFSYHNENPATGVESVIYVPGNCSQALGDLEVNRITTKIAGIGRIDRVTYIVDEPLMLALMAFSVLLFKRRTRVVSGNRFHVC